MPLSLIKLLIQCIYCRQVQLCPVGLFTRRQASSPASAQRPVSHFIIPGSAITQSPGKPRAARSQELPSSSQCLVVPPLLFLVAIGPDRLTPRRQASPQPNTFGRPAAAAVARSSVLLLTVHIREQG